MVVRAGNGSDRANDIDALSASLLGMVTRSLPLRTAVIVLSDGAGLQETVWRAPGTRSRCLAAARAHARASTRYFTHRPATWKIRALNRPRRRHFVSLPIT